VDGPFRQLSSYRQITNYSPFLTYGAEGSFFTLIVWRDQAQHAARSLTKGSQVVVVDRLQQRAWTAEDGSARSVVEVVAEELRPSLRWATATTRATRSQD
jgi:single-strand DNA-binding protein